MKNKILNNVTNVKNLKLKNGIPVRFIYDSDKVSSSAEIIFGLGFDTKMELQEYGLPHIFEHLMSKNIKAVEKLGGLNSASTFPEKTAFITNGLHQDTHLQSMDLFFKSFHDWVILNSLPISLDDFNREKEAIKTELRSRTISASSELANLIDFAYWGVEKKGDEIDNISLEDISSFIENYLKKCEISIIVRGNFDEGKVLEITQKYLGDFPYNPIKFPALIPSSIFGNHSKVSPYNQSAIQYFYPFFETTFSNTFIKPLFERILISLLLGELRVKRGLIYSISAGTSMVNYFDYYEPITFPIPFQINTTSNSEHTFETLSVMDNLLVNNVISVSEEMLDLGKKDSISGQLLSFDRGFIGSLDELEKNIELIHSITLNDVQKIFNDLHSQKYIRGVVGNKEF